ncbi:hypothetical protein ACTFIY_004375 [Dictyostelium cf. discoideum]
MKKSKLFIFYFFFIFILSVHVNSNELNKKEYDCLVNFLTNLGKISNVGKNEKTFEYEFCNPIFVSLPTEIKCNQGSITHLDTVQSNISYIIKDELLCFDKINYFFLSNINYDSTTFFNSFPKSLNKVILTGANLQFSKVTNDLQTLSISIISQKTPTTLKFSWFYKTTQFILSPTGFASNKSHSITFENDLEDSEIWETNYFYVSSLNLPKFNNVKGFVQIELIEGYNQTSWSNIIEIGNLTNIYIRTNDLSEFPNDHLSSMRSDSIEKINFEVPFKSVNKMCDLSSIGKSIQIITFTKCGRDFSFNGLMPIILPNNQDFKHFFFIGGYIKSFDIMQYKSAQHITLSNNLISGTLPPINSFNSGKLKYIDIGFNRITGELDDSYCEFDIIVNNNSMTGLIPTCFTCFFGLTELNLKLRFIGNNFTNLDQPSSPSIISPNLIFSNIETFLGQPHYKYYIFGENLGGAWIDESNAEIIGFDVKFIVIKPNKLISVYSISSFSSMVTFSYSRINSNYRFTLSADLIAPKLKKVEWVSNSQDLTFEGFYFSYNKSIVNISIGNVNCQVTSSTFYNINCTLLEPIDLNLIDIVSFITIGNLTTQFTLNPGVTNNVVDCINGCSGNGICFSDVGICKCDSTHQGGDCSLPYIECPTNCTNLSVCNNITGVCSCPSFLIWSGIGCSFPLHTISAVSPSDNNGGNASIYGWFGNTHTDPQVFIGNKQCIPIYNISESEINCNAPPGTGLKSVSVIQNSINVTSKDIYQYYSNDKQCPNHCTSTSNGICNTTTGYCNCIGRWSGYDCSLYSNPSGGNNNGGLPGSNTTIDGNTGNTNITNQHTNYQILITKLIEIDFNGNQINEYQLLNRWSIISNISKTVYTFIQSIQNDKCNITYTIEEINKDRYTTFAGINFKLTSGSVKMTVSIENYQYSSNLNTLQLQMKSSVNKIQTNNENDCNDDQIEINGSPNQENSLNYITIKKDAKVLNGRFIDRIESDGISTFMQTVLISKSNDSIIVGMNLPHCTKKCLLDPDFSVLVSPEFIDECSGDNDRKSWFLPVVVVVPIVFLTLIIIFIVITIKKRFVEMYLFRSKIKQLANLNK